MIANTSIYKTRFFLGNDSLPISNIYKIPLKISETDSFKNNSTKKTYNLINNIVWTCQKCGHTHIGAFSVGNCPICGGNLTECNK